uniref:Ig-like domain-containing protein n=1 Tax=Oryctolagus cuniculus TaxID=9986 RepID=G1SYZ2_RABIT
MLLPLLLSLLSEGTRAQEYRLQAASSVMVQEGLCVFVPCSLTYPQDSWTSDTPAYGYWFRSETHTISGFPVATNRPDREVQADTQGRFLLMGDPSQYNCSLLLREARREDSGWYLFRLERGPQVKYNFKQWLYLDVAALTQKPDIFIPGMLEPGQPANAICVFKLTSEHCPAPTFSWTGAAVSAHATQPLRSHFSVLSLTPRPQDQGTGLTCHADFAAKSTQETVHLRLAYAPKDLVISVSWDKASAPEPLAGVRLLEAPKGRSLRLLCAADSQPPATLTWLLGDRVLSRSLPSGPTSLALELPGLEPADSGHYTCHAANGRGSQNRSLDLAVQYPPESLTVIVSQGNRTVLENLGNGTALPVLEGQSLRLVCSTHSQPPAQLSWARGTQTLSRSQPSEPGVLELPRVQPEHEGALTCLAQNPLGSLRVFLSLSVQYPPQLQGPSCSWEAGGLCCSCSSRARPAPSLRWRLGERLLAGNSSGNSSHASFTVTSSSAGPWANSSLSLRGELGSDLRLSCEARNVQGAQSVTILLLPDEGLASVAFSKGVYLGIGVTTLLFLCLILIIVKMLRKKPAQPAVPRAKVSRSSTILDYINVVPKVRTQKAKPGSPSQTPAPGAHSPEPRRKQKGPHGPAPTAPPQAPQALRSECGQEELHYAALSFPGPRPWAASTSAETHVDYAEIKFH